MTHQIVRGGRNIRHSNALRDTVVREFDGGLNVIDSDLNLASRFAKELNNMYRGKDGAISLRFGTTLFADCATVLGDDIINMYYFSNNIIAVGANGKVSATDGTANTTLIWDDAIAAVLPDAPDGWGTTTFVDFAQPKEGLIVCNGLDKPLIIDKFLSVDYLQDLATQSNGNTPIGKFVITNNKFTIMVDPSEPSTLRISQENASGTYTGDPDPNNAVDYDVGSDVGKGSTEITGLATYRSLLVVTCAETTLIYQLGTFDSDGDHQVTLVDTIEEHGGVSHRAIQSLGSDVLYLDNAGVPSLERAQFTGDLKPERAGQLVDPAIRADIGGLSFTTLEEECFSIYNRLEGQYMLFIPNSDDANSRYETFAYVYTVIKGLKVRAWSTMSRWNWQSACRSQQGRVFFSKGSQIFKYGSENDQSYADFIGDQETWSDDTTFDDDLGFTPISSIADSGLPIPFAFELPWADFDKRMRSKKSEYLMLDTEGTGEFKVEMFVDRIYEDKTDPGENFSDGFVFDDDTGFIRNDPLLRPELSTEFVGGDVGGFGDQFAGDLFGSGRVTDDQRLYSWTSKFKIAKLRISGETKKPLKIVAIGMLYKDGSIRR